MGTYPKTISKAGCARNFRDKLRAFTSVPPGRMTLIAPSRWLADLVGESFLAGYPVEVRHNTIDATVFRPTPSDFRERHGIGDRFMILGVASPWTERKGLGDFIRLTEELDADGFAIVLVGLSERQIRYLQKQLAALPRTQHERGIARTYTAADILARLAVGGVCGSATSGIRSCGVHVAVTEAPPCAEISDRMNAAVVLPDWSALKAAVVKLAGGGLVILAARTESKEQLAAIYTAADAFFNPTLEDNFPTVNLEAEACGTPVITYNTGGCAETIHLPVSRAIDGWQGCPIQG